ncbi:glycosyltransferase family 2 protein [Alkalinema pantanalense]|uniref:glycosyltransferase n=1 Tax=Alkalinema pantanalense TaxID=1620705 RepID=UPI003D6FB776
MGAFRRQFYPALQASSALQIPLELEPVSVELKGTELSTLPSVSVIVPAYNEAVNIEGCLLSILESSEQPIGQLEVWVVDDQSTDQTLAIAKNLQDRLQDPRLHILAGQPRPMGEAWMGKNWACAQAVQWAKGEYLLFLDADVRLRRGAIEAALVQALDRQADLLTCWLTLVCDCWGEWLAQPMIAQLFAVGFKQNEVNDPSQDAVFAVGPFMLFRRSAYDAIGGHRAVAAEIVEDVELGKRIKRQGWKLWFGTGAALGELRMYRSLGALWEGWTKNWHLGSERNWRSTLYSAYVVGMVFVLPWWTSLAALGGLVTQGMAWATVSDLSMEDWLQLGFAGLNTAIALFILYGQYELRQRTQMTLGIPKTYWWLGWLGSLIVFWIPIVSLIKTETGWGWTWRGRPLKLR